MGDLVAFIRSRALQYSKDYSPHQLKPARTTSATCMPPEVLLCIFSFLKRQPPDWTYVFQTFPINYRPQDVQRTFNDLRAACLACRAWRACASAVLFTLVDLRTPRRLQCFARSLAENPALASCVQAAHLPTEIMLVPDRPPWPLGVARWRRRRLALATNDVLTLCGSVTEITLSRMPDARFGVHGFPYVSPAQVQAVTQYSRHIKQLLWAIVRHSSSIGIHSPRLAVKSPLTHLTLQGMSFARDNDVAWPHLRYLCLRNCFPPQGWISRVLARAPCISTLRVEGLGYPLLQEPWESSELRPASATLRELHVDRSCAHIRSGFAFLARLRVLEIHTYVLDGPADVALPAGLEMLVLSTRREGLDRGLLRSQLLRVCAAVKARLPVWKRDASPHLATLEIAGDVDGSLEDWAVASYLLRPHCERLGVALRVSLL